MKPRGLCQRWLGRFSFAEVFFVPLLDVPLGTAQGFDRLTAFGTRSCICFDSACAQLGGELLAPISQVALANMYALAVIVLSSDDQVNMWMCRWIVGGPALAVVAWDTGGEYQRIGALSALKTVGSELFPNIPLASPRGRAIEFDFRGQQILR